MNNISEFKNQIFKYGILIAAIAEVISLPIIGLNMQFTYGLALGTCISIVNMYILIFTAKKALDAGGPFLSVVGYILRMGLYCWVFYISVKVSMHSAAGTMAGFMTLKIALYYALGFKPGLTKSSNPKGKKYNDLDNDVWEEKKKKKQAKKEERRKKHPSIFSSSFDDEDEDPFEPGGSRNDSEKKMEKNKED